MHKPDLDEQRVQEALRYGIEMPTIEFKAARPFEELKYKLAKCAQAMANNRDGGIIVIGINEHNDGSLTFSGLTPEVEQTYKRDAVYDRINAHASPAIELRQLAVTRDGKRFIALLIPPVGRSPTICKKGTPAAVTGRDAMEDGALYFRTTEQIGTDRVRLSIHLESILNPCWDARATELIRLVGSQSLEPAGNEFEREVDDIADLL